MYYLGNSRVYWNCPDECMAEYVEKNRKGESMNLRHEWKHEINAADMITLRLRLRAVMKTDAHAVMGKYEVRSLYFDNEADKVLMEKVNGVAYREKFRIRYYNNDTTRLMLEKKSKYNCLGHKQTAALTTEEAQAIADGQYHWMVQSRQELIRELYSKIKSQGLRAKTIVHYTREPYVFEPGNVRVTLDYNIRTGYHCTNFLNPDCVMIPAGEQTAVLEVKWDAFLPDIIRDVVQLEGRQTAAFSKYQVCRMYG